MDEFEITPLSAADTLATAGLVAPDDRGDGSGDGSAAEATVACGRPLVYPVPPDDLPEPLRRRVAATGGRVVGLFLAFDLDRPPPGQRYADARFTVELADPRAMALRIDADGGAAGLVFGIGDPYPASPVAARTVEAAAARPGWLARLPQRGDRPRASVTAGVTAGATASVSGLQRHRFTWRYEDPRGDLALPDAFGMHAIVELPAGAGELRGSLDVEVALVRSTRRGQYRRAIRTQRTVPFAESLAGAAAPSGAAVRLCMAADVVAYSAQSTPVAERTQRRLVDVLARARRHAGVDEGAVRPQPQGDGQFTVLPVGIDEAEVIPRFVRGLRDALREVNLDLDGSARLRLRVALHRGLVKEADNGWVGNPAVAVHRILDSPPLRLAIASNPAADYVLGLPDFLFRDVIAPSAGELRPERFTEETADLPSKHFTEVIWIYIEPAAA